MKLIKVFQEDANPYQILFFFIVTSRIYFSIWRIYFMCFVCFKWSKTCFILLKKYYEETIIQIYQMRKRWANSIMARRKSLTAVQLLWPKWVSMFLTSCQFGTANKNWQALAMSSNALRWKNYIIPKNLNHKIKMTALILLSHLWNRNHVWVSEFVMYNILSIAFTNVVLTLVNQHRKAMSLPQSSYDNLCRYRCILAL